MTRESLKKLPRAAATSGGEKAATVDPNFAAIERHKRAFTLKMEAMLTFGDEPDNGPRVNSERLAKLKSVADAARAEAEEAVWGLTPIRPTSAAALGPSCGTLESSTPGKLALPIARRCFGGPPITCRTSKAPISNSSRTLFSQMSELRCKGWRDGASARRATGWQDACTEGAPARW